MKSAKKIVAALLCAAFLVPFAMPYAAAKGAKACDCGEVVQIFVDGFGQPLYYNEGTPEEKRAELIVTDNLLPTIPGVLLGLARSLLGGGAVPFAQGLAGLMAALMENLLLDPEGRSVAPIGSHWKINPDQDHKTSPQYDFRYDFRLDPFTIAAQLNEFIEALCAQTGHVKVALTGHSEGAVVAMTYLAQYGCKRLDTLILNNGGWQGLSMAGQLFSGDFGLSGAAVTNYIADLDDGTLLLKAGMNVLRASGLLDFIAPALTRFIVENLMDELFEYVLMPLFCTMPVIWSFIPGENYDAAIEWISGGPTYDTLRAKAERYHCEVYLKAESLLKSAKKAGVKVAVVAAYGPAPIPVTADAMYQSDSLIDTALMSGGATAAPIGQTLPPGNSKYRSPDGILDAATCMLPDNTWFIKYNVHDAGPARELRQWIIHAKDPDVWSNPDFPQYLQRTEDGKAVPLGQEKAGRPLPQDFTGALEDFLWIAAGQILLAVYEQGR